MSAYRGFRLARVAIVIWGLWSGIWRAVKRIRFTAYTLASALIGTGLGLRIGGPASSVQCVDIANAFIAMGVTTVALAAWRRVRA